MKTPTSLFDRPGRAAAVVGAVVAVSATAAVALVSGIAVADEPGRCTDNVNVRAEPDVTSRIVALCEAGTQVQVGEARDGFVQLVSLGGWAAQEYVSVNGRTPAPAERVTAPEGDDDARGTDARSSEDRGTDARSADARSTDDRSTDDRAANDAEEDGNRDGGTADESGTAGGEGTGDGGESTVDQDGDDTPRGNGGGLGGLIG